MVTSERDLAALAAKVAELEAQTKALADACELMDAHIAYLRQPNDVGLVQSAVALLDRQNKPIPDDLQERSLRLLLRDNPYDFELSRALIALLHRTGRPPFPDLPTMQPTAGPQDFSGLEELLCSSENYARAGDTFRVYAAMWQACVRYPQTARGWAEFARCLADRGEWSNCRIAAERVLKAAPPDEATAKAMLSALSTLAENGELASLDRNTWMEQLPAALQAHPHALKILICTNEPDSAATMLPQTMKLWPNDAETWIAASIAACEAEQLQEAYDYIRRAFVLQPVAALHAVTGEFGERFTTVVRRLKKYDEIADWISQRSNEYDAMNVIAPSPAPEAKPAVQKLRQAAMARGLPSALLVAQNKSASTTVGNIFSSGFGLPTVLYSLVNLRVVLPWLQDYLKGGACYVTHLLPLPQNIDLFVAAGVQSIIVHVRDPRQWVLSMAAHNRRYAHLVLPSWREASRGGPANTIHFVIRELLPDAIAWIDGWMKAREKLTVNFTTFEEFVRDKDKFLDRILALYGGDTRFFDGKKAFEEQSGVDYHRRLGLIDEWKSALTRQQVEYVNSLIPNEFWNLFGWEA